MKKIKNIIQILLALILIVLFVFAIVQKTSNNEKGICGIKIFTVISGSMIPVYDIGDVLVAKEQDPSTKRNTTQQNHNTQSHINR